MNAGALKDRVAVVAGATRGAGRGIAAALGEAGATVICTGRSSCVGELTSDYQGRPETIEETAELVTQLGGQGIAVPTDHLDRVQVERLRDRIERDHRHIDVLVNNIWGAETLKGSPAEWNKPIWEVDLDKGLRILRLAVDTHLITSHYLLPLLVKQPGGLLVEVTDGSNSYNAKNYRISVYYDLAKTAVNRLAFSQGHELSAYNATAVAVTPGWMRSEIMLEAFHTTEESWRTADAPPGFKASETPRYIGRAVAAMAADSERGRWNQQSLTAADLAAHYGFTDLDGSQPDIWRYMQDVESNPNIDPNDYR